MRVVCLADTHARHLDVTVPEGDLLAFAGDACEDGTLEELRAFGRWLAALPHPHKVVIAGNNDRPFEGDEAALARAIIEDAGALYLEETGAEVGGLRVYGHPWTPWPNQKAFSLPRGSAVLAEKHAAIPPGLDLLLVHGPPHGLLDKTEEGRRTGCELLAERLAALDGAAPRAVVYGHIHEGHGVTRRGGTLYVNAAVCDAQEQPAHAPVVLDL